MFVKVFSSEDKNILQGNETEFKAGGFLSDICARNC